MNVVQKLRAFGELVVFQHTLFALPFVFIAMIVAARGWFGWALLGLGLGAAVCARNFAMGFNRLVDRRYDALNPRTANRPSIDGRLSLKAIIVFVAANAICFVAICYFINPLAFALSTPFLIILGSYSFIKRVSWAAHLVLGLSLGLAPIAGAVAALGEIPIWSLPLAAGVTLWSAGFDLLYSLQDREFDQKAGLFSIPARFGAANTLIISRVFHVAALLFWICFCVLAQLGGFAWIGVCVSGAMLIAEHRIAADGMQQINRAFFTLNAWLSVVFFAFITLDFIWAI
ncbi:MAG: 4-hydroxybenzoate polyprenyltransferase [Helicobacteraceae bacterium]|jgi:4-hydroxybenzoate polyprenyltransferase|nr:4-hydroxybenzoate polyprenyltransferase [Helicobacteraceae bacterium]